ncbi:diguanylate cyclase (GGDEF)-like protein [Litoreibacter ponti]|uniref:diguanylate cyclase n=1 Tax=Litoreibacter ponti TaxID=1510457 RepID=A0A2T6BJX6_9RHOB|nr:diguanylate cyclase (GGDEF)-like protein [Litoreibacter ponti]
MRIKSRIGIASFAIAIAAVSVSFSALMVQIVFPPELHEFTTWRAVLITVTVTIPIAMFIGVKIYENTALSLELQRLVNRDRLTDVATRDFFFKVMDRNPDAYGVSLMVDIDNFKAVNDKHGHLAGDEVIKTVSDVLRKECRSRDIVCRFGGEEFIVFLHQASAEQGAEVAERIRKAVEQEPTMSDDAKLCVTVSIGGSLKEAADDITQSIKRADDALYRAKENGRNRIVMDLRKAA